MKIDQYEKIGVSKYRLYLDNGEVVDTYDDVILKYELLLKRELTREIYQSIFIETSLQEQYNACVKYIGIRIRSTKEIEDYLRKRKVEDEDIFVIIERLKKAKFLDDAYFAKCFVHDKLKFTTMGKYQIEQELKKHRIDSSIINEVISEVDDDVMRDKIFKLIEKKQRSNHKLDKFKLRNQLYHQLLRLGYPSSLIVEGLDFYFR